MYFYLRIALFLGFYGHVCRLTNKWGAMYELRSWHKYVAYRMSETLFLKGYPYCPSCHWPVEHKDKHLQNKDSWCYEASLSQCPRCKCFPLYPEGCRYCNSLDEEEKRREQERKKILAQHQEEKDWDRRVQEETEHQKEEMDRQRNQWDALMAVDPDDKDCEVPPWNPLN